MELVNATGMPAAYTLGLDPDGRERIVVVVKGTFSLPAAGGPPTLAASQEEHIFADTFTGEPGHSSVVYESEFAPQKKMCDVLVVGSAHAPNGRPTSRVTVGFRVGSVSKSFEVVGRRHWTAGLTGLAPSRPEPFLAMPISYDVAFGGTEAAPNTPGMVNSYEANPVGVGFFKQSSDNANLGKPVPNTDDPSNPVVSPRGRYKPMAFGPVGRNFVPRRTFAGTYDQRWQEEVYPFLPRDFDARYYQAAPPDQQMPYPVGGEPVQLMNLTPKPVPPFLLPKLEMPVEVSRVRAGHIEQQAVVDTIILEPDRSRIQLIWRASLPLVRNLSEVSEVVVGRMPKSYYRARRLGKTYYPSLRDLGRLPTEGA